MLEYVLVIDIVLNSQDAVTELYVFHRQYLETHPLEQAGRKTVDVEEKLKETLSLLDSVQGLIHKGYGAPFVS